MLSLVIIPKNVFSQNIFDVKLDNFYIGDSLLNYYSHKDIKDGSIDKYPNSNKFTQIQLDLKNSKYDQIAFNYKTDDNSYTIYSISTGKFFGKDNLDICLNYKKKIVNEYAKKYNIQPQNYEHKYNLDDKKSIAYNSDFELEGGLIRMWCVNWSDLTEKRRGYVDNFQISISSKTFVNFLNNEAY